jgi:hypothetical protein
MAEPGTKKTYTRSDDIKAVLQTIAGLVALALAMYLTH